MKIVVVGTTALLPYRILDCQRTNLANLTEKLSTPADPEQFVQQTEYADGHAD